MFTKEYNPNWSEDFIVISKIKNTLPWTYVISDLNSEYIIGLEPFMKKNCRRLMKKKKKKNRKSN